MAIPMMIYPVSRPFRHRNQENRLYRCASSRIRGENDTGNSLFLNFADQQPWPEAKRSAKTSSLAFFADNELPGWPAITGNQVRRQSRCLSGLTGSPAITGKQVKLVSDALFK
ncbi:MAG: hypothetical protein LKG80_06115 [Lachnospiraceae bacterium]|nr:hypothetical protein [Lachnospiraceae bacterium]MCI1380734.1 hypothetical protein [Lachnospiraceae bacterium]MCI1401944.1 hypothetical protein [Lachnospiraceae bacterium]MCI1555745.1 hypothetical protein [Lachnospiraceae bacterium]